MSPQLKLEIKDVIYDFLSQGDMGAHTNLDRTTDLMFDVLWEYFKEDE